MRHNHKIEKQVYIAKTSSYAADKFIAQYMGFIKKETAKYIFRNPCDCDDELSIAMIAFYEAVKQYDTTRGSFIGYATTCIRNKLIDYIRHEQKHYKQILLHNLDLYNDNEDINLFNNISQSEDNVAQSQRSIMIKEEIVELGHQLNKFGITIIDVANACPRQKRTFLACQQILTYACDNPQLLSKMLHNKTLPISDLLKNSDISRKTLERHRNYIIAILLVSTNEYELIRSHIYETKLVKMTEIDPDFYDKSVINEKV